jgi:hypothetical protein
MKAVISFFLGAVLTFLVMSYNRQHPAPLPTQPKVAQDTKPFDPKKDFHPIAPCADGKKKER